MRNEWQLYSKENKKTKGRQFHRWTSCDVAPDHIYQPVSGAKGTQLSLTKSQCKGTREGRGLVKFCNQFAITWRELPLLPCL